MIRASNGSNGDKIAAMLTYFNAFISGELNSVFTHIVLLGGALAAEIAIAAGIILETPKEKSHREKLGMRLVIGGVVVSALFTIALFVFDEGISRAQQSLINKQESEILTLTRKAGDAEQLADNAIKQANTAQTRLARLLETENELEKLQSKLLVL